MASAICAVYTPRLLTCSKHLLVLKAARKRDYPDDTRVLRLVILPPIFTMRCSVAVKTV